MVINVRNSVRSTCGMGSEERSCQGARRKTKLGGVKQPGIATRDRRGKGVE